MKKNKSYVIGLFLLTALMSDAAMAPSVFATATTHIWAPSADVQSYGVVHITSDVYIAAEKDAADNRPDSVTNLGLTTGILPFEKLLGEVGFDHKTGYGDLDDYPMYFNFKVGIPEKAFGEYFPALAVGMYDLGTESDKTDYNVFYFKAGKSVVINGADLGKYSVGYFNGNDLLLLDADGNKDNDGILLAWERNVPEISDKLWVCVEYQGSESSYGCMNYGFSYKFADNTSVLFGYTDYNNDNLAGTFTVQVDIDFDVFSKAFKK